MTAAGPCSYCAGTTKRTVHVLLRGEAASVKVPCEYCRCFTHGEPCPYAAMHGPNEEVGISETMRGHHKDEGGKVRVTDRSHDKTIRYGDWEWRCRICYPRG